MKRCGLILVALLVCVSLFGCSKKQQALEEMQQPMSPEDLNRLKTGTDAEATASAPLTMQPAETQAPAVTAEPLPPAGPYKPTAKEIQTALKNAGYYNGSVDGKIGPMTKRAIEEFQKANGLGADGKVGPKTWSALGRYLQASDPSMAVTVVPAE